MVRVDLDLLGPKPRVARRRSSRPSASSRRGRPGAPHLRRTAPDTRVDRSRNPQRRSGRPRSRGSCATCVPRRSGRSPVPAVTGEGRPAEVVKPLHRAGPGRGGDGRAGQRCERMRSGRRSPQASGRDSPPRVPRGVERTPGADGPVVGAHRVSRSPPTWPSTVWPTWVCCCSSWAPSAWSRSPSATSSASCGPSRRW